MRSALGRAARIGPRGRIHARATVVDADLQRRVTNHGLRDQWGVSVLEGDALIFDLGVAGGWRATPAAAAGRTAPSIPNFYTG